MDSLPSGTALSNIISGPINTSLNTSGSATTVNGLVSQVDDIKISGSNNHSGDSENTNNELASSDVSTTVTLDLAMQDNQPGDQTSTERKPMDQAALEKEQFSQGDQLMRIKATRGSGRNQTSNTSKKSNGAGAKMVNALTASVARRILPARSRRASSLKEASRYEKSTISPESAMTVTPISSSGPARKAAKHQAGADASSSLSSSG